MLLQTTGAHSITADEEFIFVACDGGIIRLFCASTLHFIATLPKPHYLGVNVSAGIDARYVTRNISAKCISWNYPTMYPFSSPRSSVANADCLQDISAVAGIILITDTHRFYDLGPVLKRVAIDLNQ